MSQSPVVVIAFKDLEHDERVRETVEKRCEQLREEFHEVTRFELTFNGDGVGVAAHGHVHGKGEDLGAQAQAGELLPAAEALLDKLERQLRKHHDKRIFTLRREAQREGMRRKTS